MISSGVDVVRRKQVVRHGGGTSGGVTSSEELRRQGTRSSHIVVPSSTDDVESDGSGEKIRLFEAAVHEVGPAELRRVRVSIHDGCVQLDGVVASYYQKQLAQEAVRPLAIGMQISNRLQVK
ncbi:BON domain-containing protein [Stieleria sp. JC731]|uniref:BON domain-containing protein n=1 Tax=Pirellulaceae TaxID=2691357 RepID=UPI001E5B5873|nr:BON domain-containing protein [Stieleria sp. JC731]MCC9603006.1 BON domain-containing protein [Stieleria sp. JC731]